MSRYELEERIGYAPAAHVVRGESQVNSTSSGDRPWLYRIAAVAAFVLFVAGIGLWHGMHQGEATASIDFFAQQDGQP